MVQLSSALLLTLSALSLHAHGAPIQKRIAQVIADSTALWEKACVSHLLPSHAVQHNCYPDSFRTVRTRVS